MTSEVIIVKLSKYIVLWISLYAGLANQQQEDPLMIEDLEEDREVIEVGCSFRQTFRQKIR